MREYKGIDVFKFIMALFIVILHTHPLYQINGTLDFLTADVIARLAVPFFFAVSGFLLENHIRNDADVKGVLSRYIRKILGLYCVWTIVYMPVIIYEKIINTDDTLIRGMVTVVRDFFFVGSYTHLWYLPAIAVGFLVVYTLRKYLGERKTAIVLVILFLAGLLTQSYFGLLTYAVDVDSILWKMMKAVKKIMVTCRNGVFFGSIFIYMGTWIARSNVTVKRWKVVTGLAVSTLFFHIEEAYLWKIGSVRETDMYLMLLLSVFFLTVLAVQLSVKGNTIFLRKMSMNIYYIHLYFKFIYREFIDRHTGYNVGLFLFTMIGAFVVSYLMYRIAYLMKSRKA